MHISISQLLFVCLVLVLGLTQGHRYLIAYKSCQERYRADVVNHIWCADHISPETPLDIRSICNESQRSVERRSQLAYCALDEFMIPVWRAAERLTDPWSYSTMMIVGAVAGLVTFISLIRCFAHQPTALLQIARSQGLENRSLLVR